MEASQVPVKKGYRTATILVGPTKNQKQSQYLATKEAPTKYLLRSMTIGDAKSPAAFWPGRWYFF